MRTQSALIASITSLALALPGSVLAAQGQLGLEAPEEEELVLEDEEEEEEPPEDEGPSEEEKLEMAKALYVEGTKMADKGNWTDAAAKYEEAYRLVPSKHGFAHKVGMAAYKAGNCDKTVEFLVHFIHYTDHEKDASKIEEAQKVLGEMLDKGCTTEQDIHYYHLSDDERTEMAKDIYVQAETLASEEKWKEAEALYEEAYILVPHKIGFSHKVGIAAYNAWKQNESSEDCDKAHEYLVHFVDFADEDKYADKLPEANAILEELMETCVSKEAKEVHQLENSTEAFDAEDPFAEGGSDGGKGKGKKGGGNGLLIGGVLLTVVGAGGLGVGAAGLVMAGQTASQLNDLASLETTTGYPTADYSDARPLESQLASRKLMGYVGLAAGGALFVTGIALIAVHAVKKKKKPSSSARLEGVAPSFGRNQVGASALVRF